MPVTFEKGNIVKFKRSGDECMVVAVAGGKERVNLHVFGSEEPRWYWFSSIELVCSTSEECWKCHGSGLYYFGGATVNGVYKGRTGPCFACEGKGSQNNDDRIRCYHYWRRGKYAEFNEDGNRVPSKLTAPGTMPVDRAVNEGGSRKSERMPTVTTPRRQDNRVAALVGSPTVTQDDIDSLVDCSQCGCLHLSNVSCPWDPGRNN